MFIIIRGKNLRYSIFTVFFYHYENSRGAKQGNAVITRKGHEKEKLGSK